MDVSRLPIHLLLQMDHHRLRLSAMVMLLVFHVALINVESSSIGINYGMLGNDLPPPAQVVILLQSLLITKTRLFHPDHAALTALRNSGIEVILGTFNEDLPSLASSPSAAAGWVSVNVAPYSDAVTFRAICVGNEVIPGYLAANVLPAMQNLAVALQSAGLSSVPVTTAVSTSVLGQSYPPSAGAFSDAAQTFMGPIVSFLSQNNAPLLANVYPYFAYSADPGNVTLSYALLNSADTVVEDGVFVYSGMFEAIVDALYVALEKVGGPNVEVVVTETGWPSAGGAAATADNAQMYVNNVARRAASQVGTPRRPGKPIETYLFALFNENQKPAGVEQNFGIFYSSMQPVYPVLLP